MWTGHGQDRRNTSGQAARAGVATASVALVMVVAAGGCQSYRAEPLDVAGHRAAVVGRLAGAESVEAFSLALATAGGAGATVKVADGLSMEEGELVALVFNPGLREARARARVSEAHAEFAGVWDDPVFGLDVERVLDGVDDPWVVGGTVGLTLPVSGRLAVERSRARAEHDAELRRVAAEEWRVRMEVRRAWAEWTAASERAALAAELDGRLAEVAGLAESMLRGGVMSRAEARLFTIERAMRSAQWRQSESERRSKELALRAMLGLRAQAPVMLGAAGLGGWGDSAVDGAVAEGVPEDVVDLLESGNVTLAVKRAEHEVAEQGFRLAIREQYPDLEIGPGLRSDQGEGRALLGVSVPLAVWNGGRGRIAQARAERDAAREGFMAEFERQVAALEAATAARWSARAVRQLLEGEVAPLAEEQEREARRMAELAEVDAILLLDSLTRLADVKAMVLEARLDEAMAAVAVAEVLGPGQGRAEVNP